MDYYAISHQRPSFKLLIFVNTLYTIIRSRIYVSIKTSQRVLASDRAREGYLISAGWYRLSLYIILRPAVLHSAD